MKERPILFSAPMVRAILDGRKTQTRRVVKPQPDSVIGPPATKGESIAVQFTPDDERLGRLGKSIQCPYGQPGDRLWVRETFDPIYGQSPPDRVIEIDYKADWQPHGNRWRMMDEIGTRRWKPSIHMPRWSSRILLEITAVRVERLDDISEADALVEGIRPFYSGSESPSAYGINEEGCGFGKAGSWRFPETPRAAFRQIWESINGTGSWAANPWVWVVEFRKVTP